MKLFIFILLLIIITMLSIIIVLMHKKQINILKTKRFIHKYINYNNNIDINELKTGDIVCFINKENIVLWTPYYFTHIGIIFKENGVINILEGNFDLKGIYLIEFNDYIKKYCGDIFLIKMKWNNDELISINKKIQKILKTNKQINNVETSNIIDVLNVFRNKKYSCTGLVSDIIHKRDDIKTPDDIIMDEYISSKISYIKKIKKQNIHDSCYFFYNGNQFSGKHVIEK